MKKDPIRADSLIVNKELPLKSEHYDTAKNVSSWTKKITATFIPLTSENTDSHTKTDTTLSILHTETKSLKPKIKRANPFISHVNHPKPVKAGDLGSTGLSNQNIMFLSEEQGLPSSNIRAIAEDSKGSIWIGHINGLTKYDGYNFFTYNTRSGLPSNFITKIIFDKDSSLWIGTKNGLVHYDGNSFKIYNTACGLPGNYISDIALDKNNNVWFVCQESGVVKLKNDSLKIYTNESGVLGDVSFRIGVDDNNNIVVGSWGGWPYFIENEKIMRSVREKERFIPGSLMNKLLGSNVTTCIYKDRKNSLWFGCYNGGVINYYPNHSIRYIPNTGLPYFLFNDIMQDSDNKMWFGTGEGGAVRMDNKGYTIYTTKQGLTSNKITCFLEDSKKNIWVGTQDGGVNRIKPSSFRNYSSLDGLSDKPVASLAVNRRGHVLIGTWGGGIYEFDGKRFIHYDDGKHLDIKIVLAMKENKEGNLFVGTHQHGFDMLSPSKNDSLSYDSCYYLSAIKGFGSRMAYGIYISKNGDVWIANQNEQGLTKYYYTGLDKYSKVNGLASNSMYGITGDKKGNIWLMNSFAGISKINKNKIEHFTKQNGLPANEATSIFVDSNDDLWVGTAVGISKFNGKEFSLIDTKDGLSNNFITSIIEDKKKRLWLGTSRGLNVLTPDKTKPKGYSIEYFLLQDGLKSNSFNPGAVVMDSANNIWWGTSKGAIKLNLDEYDNKESSPECHVTQINLMDNYINFRALKDSINKGVNYYDQDSTMKLNGIKFSDLIPYCNLPVNLKLPYNINTIILNFYAFNGNSPHRIKYRYRLLGSNDSWINVNYPEVKYSNLDAGNYTFEAQAKLEGQEWGTACNYSFEVKPPFWKTFWFRLLSIGLIIYSIVFVFRLRNKQLLDRQEQLETTVKERTHEIEHQKHLIEEKQKEIVDSINYAKRIQYALLAHKDFLKENIPQHFIFFNPKDIVSGDFYWATKKGDRFYLAVCDSTGHGVPGAFMSLLSIGFLTEAIGEKNIEKPNEVFNFVRQRLIENISKEGQRDGFDGILICIDSKTKKMTYASANNEPVLMRDYKISEQPGDRMPVGMGEKKESFNLFEIDLKENDVIYLYTDGYADQFGGPKGKKFKYGKLNQLLLDISSKPFDEQREILQLAFDEWRGELEQVDDVCIIGIGL